MHIFSKKTDLKAFLIALILFLISLPAVLQAKDPQNVLIIGWDGCNRETVKEMMAARELPNLADLIREGRLVDIDVTTGATETKPGWAQILTGYAPEITGVHSNRRYQPIPEGFTILERVEKALGDDKIHTAIISGKSVNMDSDAPRRVPYEWWSRHSDTNGLLELFSPKKRIERIGARIVEEDGKKYVSIPGKVYHLTRKGIDSFVNGLGNNHKTAEYAMDAMVRQKNNPFFMAVIFAEPDNSGHKYGEGSRGYKNGIRACDDWTGAILGKLKELGIYDRTLIYVVSDHGFDAGRRTHNKAPRVFLATNDRQVNRNGDRADIAPTILKRFGIHPARIVPALTGTALDEPLPHQNR